MLNYIAKLMIILMIATVTTGCASILGGTKQKVSVSTGQVIGATCDLENNAGKWHINQTPANIEIHRSAQDLKVHCQKPGYQHMHAKFSSKTRTLAYGNVIMIGGIIGASIDMANGAAYDYPNNITVSM